MSTTNASPTPLPRLRLDTHCLSPTVARITVVGEVDLATVPLLRDRLISVLLDHTPAVVDIDLAGVSFLDCAGIGALVAARNIAVQSGRQIRVAHPRPAIHRVLELTGLLSVLTAPIDHQNSITQPALQPHADALPAALAEPM